MNETTPNIDPQHAMLLVMDCQAAIVGSIPEPDGLLAYVAAASASARGRGVQIGYVRVAFGDADHAAAPETNKAFAGAAAGHRFRDDAPETAIHEAVAPKPGDLVVCKTRVGAFSTTDLDRQLRARAVDTLILAGIATGGVVLSTVRDAADRDYRLYVLEDGCFDRDPAAHELLMEKVFPRQTYVVSSVDLPDLLTPR